MTPLDEVSSLAALRTLSVVREREGWSYAAAARIIADYGTTERARSRAGKLAFEPDYTFDDNTIYRAIKEGKPPFDAASKAIWLWATDTEEPLYLDIHMEVDLERNEQLVSALKEALGHGSDFDFAKVRAFAGTYRLYRPHHLDPKSAILVSRLTIGGEDGHFECDIETVFEDEFCEERRNVASGKIIPHGPRLLAILSTPGSSRSNFILHFDDIDHRLEDQGGIKGMGGIMLSAASTGPASAWPIYARRIADDEEFTPHFIEAGKYAQLPAPVRDRLDRGAVYWREKIFQSPSQLRARLRRIPKAALV